MITEKRIHKEIDIPASVYEVWKAWTTTEGTKSFFSPESEIELFPGGKYEIYFLMKNPYGLRGSEDCKILSYIPNEMFSFSWSAPPSIPAVRKERTWVVLQFLPNNSENTHLILNQLGWKEGDDWDRAYNYFQNAWDVVINRLRQRFETGPVDWTKINVE